MLPRRFPVAVLIVVALALPAGKATGDPTGRVAVERYATGAEPIDWANDSEARLLRFADWTLVIRDAASADPRSDVLGTGIDRDALYLVRDARPFEERAGYRSLFQRAGFHLAVVDDPTSLAGEKRVQVLPIPPGETVVLGRPRSSADPPDPRITGILDRMEPGRYMENVRSLAAIPSRFACGDMHFEARDLLLSYYADLGYETSVRAHGTPCLWCERSDGESVFAVKPGATRPQDVYFVNAHYDSKVYKDVCLDAPGANDNASGVAAVMELARVFADVTTEATIAFVDFDSEELWLTGSIAYTWDEWRSGHLDDLKGFVNFEMIGFHQDTWGAYLEGFFARPEQRQVVDDVAAWAGMYTDLAVETGLLPWESDHVPLLVMGVPGLMVEGMDWALDTAYHTRGDLPDRLDPVYGVEMARIAGAALATWAGVLSVGPDATAERRDAPAEVDGTTGKDRTGNGGCGG